MVRSLNADPFGSKGLKGKFSSYRFSFRCIFFMLSFSPRYFRRFFFQRGPVTYTEYKRGERLLFFLFFFFSSLFSSSVLLCRLFIYVFLFFFPFSCENDNVWLSFIQVSSLWEFFLRSIFFFVN